MMPMAPTLIYPLAQAQDGPWDILLWSGVLIGLLLAAWIAIAFFRNRSQSWQNASQAPPFSLHELRRMHREGQLSDEEFERARERILTMTTRDTHPGEESDDAGPTYGTAHDPSPTPDELDRSPELPDPSPDAPEGPDKSDSHGDDPTR